MRKVVQESYGPPEVLRIIEAPQPQPGAGEVLVRVHASTVTRSDAMRIHSREYRFARVFTGIRRPRRTSFGTEFAGVVAALGPGASGFEAGDRVFGIREGALADYIVVKDDGVIARMPESLSFEEAAAIPDGALLALSSLRPLLPVQGKDVLVYGAAGAIGAAAVQLLAHEFGANVTAACDARDVEAVRELGAGEVLDRFTQDFTSRKAAFDLVFDAVGKHSFRRARRALKPKGVYVSMDLGFLYHLPALMLATKLSRGRRARVAIGTYKRRDLETVCSLVDAGKYRPVIDRVCDFSEIVAAATYVDTGQKRGSVVLRLV